MEESLFSDKYIKSSRIVYTPSSFAHANLLFLQEIGSLTTVSPHISARKNLSSFLFFVVTDGSGSLTYDGKNYKLQKGDCVFINCKTPYSHCSSEDLWSLYWCHFYGPNALGIYNKYIERGGEPVFKPKSIAEYVDILTELYSIASSSEYIRDMQIYSQLAALCTLIMKESWHPEIKGFTAQKRDIFEIKNYIDVNYSQKLSLEFLANRFYISKHYLARRFKEQCGMTVTNYIHLIRVERSKTLLRFSNKSVENIAEQCGFSEPNYFSRIFKKIEGISPAEYRKNWKG